MLNATWEGFQDELQKIADASVFQPIPARKPGGMHLHSVGGDAPPTANMRGVEFAPTKASPVRAPAMEATGVLPAPKAPAAVPHAPAAVPHPAVHAPSGGGLRVGAMKAIGAVRQHAAPLAIGSAVGLGLGAMAMRKRQSNAPPR